MSNDTTWNIDPDHSAILFTVRHMVVSKVRGRFRKWSGTVRLDEQDLTASQVEVHIDAGSIDTDVEKRDTHLRSSDFFDVEKHPELTFRSTSIQQEGDERFRLTGDISIRGVSKEITLEVTREGKTTDPWGNPRMFFEAKGSLNRKDFGLEWNQALETGGVMVGDRIDIEVEAQIVKAQEAERAA